MRALTEFETQVASGGAMSAKHAVALTAAAMVMASPISMKGVAAGTFASLAGAVAVPFLAHLLC